MAEVDNIGFSLINYKSHGFVFMVCELLQKRAL